MNTYSFVRIQDYEALAEKFDIDDILVLYALKFVGQGVFLFAPQCVQHRLTW